LAWTAGGRWVTWCLFGPRPAEVLGTLAGLPGIAYVRGNTDRYVLTGEQPVPHSNAGDAARDPRLVERMVAMAGAIGWTRGALVQSGVLDAITDLPTTICAELPDGGRVLGVHASPGRDDGPGIASSPPDEVISSILGDCGADVVIGGHTDDPTDRIVGAVRALNPGSVGLSRQAGLARRMLVEADEEGVSVDLRRTPHDANAVVNDLYDRGYPNAAYLEKALTGSLTFGS